MRAQATTAPRLPVYFDISKIADGVYLAFGKPHTITICNAVIFENDRDLLIVDTHSKPSAAVSLLRQLKDQVTTKPVRYVVASHFHWDHSHGLPLYRRIAPNADLVSTGTTRRLISEETLPRLKASFDQLRATIDSYKKSMSEAKTAEDRAQWKRMIAETEDYLHEMRDFKPELPNVTVNRDLIIHDKAHDLHLAFRGRGHTSGDVIVFCPQKKVVATGDLLHGFFPFLGDAYPLDWPRTLVHVAQFEFGHIAGGHGPAHPRRRAYQMANYIEELTEEVAKGRRNGKPLAALEREITPEKLKSLADGNYGPATAESVWNLRMLPPPKPSPATILAEAVKTNIGHIHARLERTA
jgi:glyoxylase-like metal-dependent hydrolase (beta-lactamase superfamily II)